MLIFGCECTGTERCLMHPKYSATNAPIAYLVERNGRQLFVCTRCNVSSDKKVFVVPTQKDPLLPFIMYDPIGAFLLTFEVSEGTVERYIERD